MPIDMHTKLLHKDFIEYKQTGVYSSCQGILSCPECEQNLKDSNLIGWGMLNSFHRPIAAPALLYECNNCFVKSYAHTSSAHVYQLMKNKFGENKNGN